MSDDDTQGTPDIVSEIDNDTLHSNVLDDSDVDDDLTENVIEEEPELEESVAEADLDDVVEHDLSLIHI